MNRRQFIAALAATLPLAAQAGSAIPHHGGLVHLADLRHRPAAIDKKITVFNMHTHERETVTFFSGHSYVDDELAVLNKLMRDHRTGEHVEMDRRLITLLYDLHEKTGSKTEIHILSGYRSEKTNERLRKTTDGVAKKSYHMKGQALDIKIPDVRLSRLHKAARSARKGGVGYYPDSGFIHIDTGRLRHWT